MSTDKHEFASVKFTKIQSEITKDDDDINFTDDSDNKDDSVDDSSSDIQHYVKPNHPETFGFFETGRELEPRTKNHQFTHDEIEKLKLCESQNYLPSSCETYKYYIHTHDVISKKHYYKWLLMFLIGFTVGIIGYLLKSSIHIIIHEKLHLIDQYIHQSKINKAFGIFVGIGLCLIICSASVVIYICPYAASSGVPEVIAHLNGIYLPKYFNITVLLIKFISCVLCVASSIPVGPEGPMIAMGAVVGYCISVYNSNCNELKLFNNSKNCRDLVSAGCASGVSSAFGAPIGGLLFSMEEVSSFWNTKLGWQIFFASMTAVFITSLLLSSIGGFEHKSVFGLFDPINVSIFIVENTLTVNLFIYIFAIIIGCIGGLLGSLFTFINLKVNRFRLSFNNIIEDKSILKTKTGIWCIFEVCLMVILWSIISIYIPLIFECKYIEKSIYNSKELLHLHSYNCVNERDSNEWIVYNEAATLLLSNSEDAIHSLLSRQTYNLFNYGSLFFILILYFIFSVYLAGSIIACGFVIPMIFIGALYGRIVGVISNDLFGIYSHPNNYWSFLDPGVMALLGSASFFGGVSRLTMSLTVIFLEMTNDTILILPIMVTIMISKWIGDVTTHSLYHALLELKCLPFLDNNVCCKYNLELFSIKYIMTPASFIVPLNEIMKINNLINILNGGHHGVYPMVNINGCYIGNILSKHLHYILSNIHRDNYINIFCKTMEEAQIKCEQCNNQFNTIWKPEIKFQDMNLLFGGNDYQNIQLEKEDKYLENYYICLTQYINKSSFVIYQTTSISRAYILFRTMGLRHLTCINNQNKIVGVVTRYDLLGVNIEQRVDKYIQTHKFERDNIPTQNMPKNSIHRFSQHYKTNKSLFRQKSMPYFD